MLLDKYFRRNRTERFQDRYTNRHVGRQMYKHKKANMKERLNKFYTNRQICKGTKDLKRFENIQFF